METNKKEEEKKDGAMKKRGRPPIIGARERTWSDGNIEEFLRKKRDRSGEEEEEEVEAFKKSKVTARSPERERNVEERIDDLKKLMSEMKVMREEMKRCFKEEFMKLKTEQRGREEEWKKDERRRRGN